MMTTVSSSLAQHFFDVAFDLANNAGRLIQRITDTRDSAASRDDTFQRLVRTALVSFDQLVDDADQYILMVEESGDAPLDYQLLEGLADRLRTLERELKRLMDNPETPGHITRRLDQHGFRRGIARTRSRIAIAAHVSKQRQVVAKTYSSTVPPQAYAAAATLMSEKLGEKARHSGD